MDLIRADPGRALGTIHTANDILSSLIVGTASPHMTIKIRKAGLEL